MTIFWKRRSRQLTTCIENELSLLYKTTSPALAGVELPSMKPRSTKAKLAEIIVRNIALTISGPLIGSHNATLGWGSPPLMEDQHQAHLFAKIVSVTRVLQEIAETAKTRDVEISRAIVHRAAYSGNGA